MPDPVHDGPVRRVEGVVHAPYANADVRAVVRNVRVMRSPFLNVELFDASYPGQRTRWPDSLDIGGWHLAGYVDDIDAAISYLDQKDTFILGSGKRLPGGRKRVMAPLPATA